MTQYLALSDSVLLKRIDPGEARTTTGLYLPESTSTYATGEVLSVGPSPPDDLTGTMLQAGMHVLFPPQLAQALDETLSVYKVPKSALVAVLELPLPSGSNRFFWVPSWADYSGPNYGAWDQYIHFTDFGIHISWLQPFRPYIPLIREIYDNSVAAFDSASRDIRGHMNFESTAEKDVPPTHSFSITDDYWHGAITLSEARHSLTFKKFNSNLRVLVETLPRWIDAFCRILGSGAFRAVVGSRHERLRLVSFSFEQQIHIEGRGTSRRAILNSDLMQQFLFLEGQADDRQQQPTIRALGVAPDNIRRLDIHLGFERAIGKRPFLVFAKLQAPANEQFTQLMLEWQLQDHSSGFLLEREYGPILTEFIRDTVIQQFYRYWFSENDDVTVRTFIK